VVEEEGKSKGGREEGRKEEKQNCRKGWLFAASAVHPHLQKPKSRLGWAMYLELGSAELGFEVEGCLVLCRDRLIESYQAGWTVHPNHTV